MHDDITARSLPSNACAIFCVSVALKFFTRHCIVCSLGTEVFDNLKCTWFGDDEFEFYASRQVQLL